MLENLILACHTQICPPPPPPPNFFRRFFLYYTLEIVASYHCMQFQGKRIIQIQENREKPHFRAVLAHCAAKISFQKSGFVSH